MSKRSLLSRLFISGVDGNVMWTGVAMANGLIIINLTFFRWFFTGVFEISILEFVLGVTPFLILARPGQKALMNSGIGSFASRYLRKGTEEVSDGDKTTPVKTQPVKTTQPRGGEPSTTNFTLREFGCKDGTPVPTKYYKNVQRLMDNLETIRAALGSKAISISSGYRTVSHNAQEGGSPKSQHLTASAADFKVAGVRASTVQRKVEQLMDAGQIDKGGIGTANTFTHYDIRGSKVKWSY